MNTRSASPRFVLIAGIMCAAVALAAGCGGGGGSSSGGGGGGGGAPPTSSPAPTSVTATLQVGPAATPSATFGPLVFSAFGTVNGTITAPAASTAATLTAVVTTSQPTGIPSPSSVARRPANIGVSPIVSLAFISVTSNVSTTLATTPALTVTFTTPAASLGQYVYLAQYSGGTWTTIEPANLNQAKTVLTISGGAPTTTYTSTPTWYVLFTVASAVPNPTVNPTAVPTMAPTAAPTIGATAAPLPDQLIFNVSGLYGETIANGLPAPRQLVALPNGDLLFGTDDRSGTVWIIPNADGTGAAGRPSIFTTVPNVSSQQPAQGLAFDPVHNKLYIATNQSVWQVPYTTGMQSAPTPTIEIAKVRRGGISSNPSPSDGDVHFTSSVAVVPSTNMLYIGVGSSCNACIENNDATRGTIQQVNLSTGQSSQALKAARFRNPLAMTVNPSTNTLWAGGAGQDDLIQLSGSVVVGAPNTAESGYGHPYEFFDSVNAAGRQAIPDYGWPVCEEQNVVYNPLNASPAPNCNAQAPATTGSGIKAVAPAVEFFAYSTIIGATFYPANQTGANTLTAFKGDAILSMHGSWHEAPNGIPLSEPLVIYVPMTSGTDRPAMTASQGNPGLQWSSLLYGFQDSTTGNRVGRPVGLAVGPTGSLFIADDFAGVIYRIRPGVGPGSKTRRPR